MTATVTTKRLREVLDTAEKIGLTDIPIEISWPTDSGSGETRKPLYVVIENSGEPEVPTLRFGCGLTYDDSDQPTQEDAIEALKTRNDFPNPPDWEDNLPSSAVMDDQGTFD